MNILVLYRECGINYISVSQTGVRKLLRIMRERQTFSTRKYVGLQKRNRIFVFVRVSFHYKTAMEEY